MLHKHPTGNLAVDYGRYSSEIQSDASIEDQARVCQERIRREGWVHVRSYQDRAMSGASRLRPAYQQLLEDARHGRFNIVVAESLDRLSRDQEDVAHLFKHLSYSDVRLFTLSEGWISELHIGLSGTMGALFLKQLAEKTHRGLRGRVESGRSGGGNSFGYSVLATSGSDGKIEHGLRKRNEAEVPHILRIMTDYSNGFSPRSIAKTLNAEGVPGPSGATWGPSTIIGNITRGTGILNNELYVGKLIWNRLHYVRNPTTGKRQSRLNPLDAWIIKDVPDLRIVPQGLWDRVKARQKLMAKETRPDAAKSKDQFWEHQRPRYLLSGLMKCATCGANYTKYGANRFACAGARDRATCTNGLTIRGADVEASILAGLKTRIMDPALFEVFAKEFIAEVNAQRMNTTAAKGNNKTALERVERQIKRLVDAIVAGADALPLNTKLRELDAEKTRLAAELAAAVDEQPLLHPNLAAIYRSQVEGLEIALRDPQGDREAFEMIRSLVEEVRLVPVDGQLSIELTGHLASILAISDGAKQAPDRAQQKALQIKLVAGARNGYYSTGLVCGSLFELLPPFPVRNQSLASLRRVGRLRAKANAARRGFEANNMLSPLYRRVSDRHDHLHRAHQPIDELPPKDRPSARFHVGRAVGNAVIDHAKRWSVSTPGVRTFVQEPRAIQDKSASPYEIEIAV